MTRLKVEKGDTLANILHLARLRGAQAKRVMPLIGNLCDRWEAIPLDLRYLLREQATDFVDAMDRVFRAVEQTDE